MPGKLEAARARIDALDRRIAVLLARRFDITAPLGALKAAVRDSGRERRVLAAAARAAGRRRAPAVKAVFLEILRQSRRLQRTG